MENVRVNLLKKVNDSYEIIISKNLFPQVVKYIKSINCGKVAIITDTNVKKLYGERLLSMLLSKKIPPALPSGGIKNLS